MTTEDRAALVARVEQAYKRLDPIWVGDCHNKVELAAALKDLYTAHNDLLADHARLQEELKKAAQERDLAWGDLGFTRNDLRNARHWADRAESRLAQLAPVVGEMRNLAGMTASSVQLQQWASSLDAIRRGQP